MLYSKNRMNPKPQISEEEMILLLRQKNERAFSVLYDNYSAALYGVILRIVMTEEIAEDVLQEAFVKIWNNFSGYDNTKGRLFTWMINIARNLAIDKTRSKDYKNSQKNLDVEKIVSYIDTKKSTSFAPDGIGVKDIVAKLKPDYFEVVDLIYFKGCTHVEAAEELKLPLGTVKTRLRMAIQQLKEMMN